MQAGRLRRAVIDRELPQFKPKLSSRVLKASVDLLAALNDQQRRAIFRAFSAEHYILIKGMPGTGRKHIVVHYVGSQTDHLPIFCSENVETKFFCFPNKQIILNIVSSELQK